MDPLLAASLPLVAWAVFAGATALSAVLGSILAYHWYRFAMNPAGATLSLIVYCIVTSAFVSCLFVATLLI